MKGDGQAASDSPKGRAVQIGWFLHQVARRAGGVVSQAQHPPAPSGQPPLHKQTANERSDK